MLSFVTLSLSERFKIARDTLGVGTRTALPVSFPASSGRIFSVVFVAPVSVIIILRTADRLRLGDL